MDRVLLYFSVSIAAHFFRGQISVSNHNSSSLDRLPHRALHAARGYGVKVAGIIAQMLHNGAAGRCSAAVGQQGSAPPQSITTHLIQALRRGLY